MKRNDYSQYDKGQEVSGVTLQQHQNQVIESLNSIMQALGLDPNEVTILWGLKRDTFEPGYDISAGAVFTNGEIFEVDAFQSPDGSPSPHMHPVTLAVGESVRFGDGIFRTAHEDYKYALSSSSTEVGSVAWAGLNRLEDKLIELVGAETYTNLKIAEVVGSEQNLDTLKKLGDALRAIGRGVTNQPQGINVNYVHPAADEVHSTDDDIVINGAVIPASELVVPVNGERTVHVFCDFGFKREGDDNDEFTAQILYRVGAGGWTPLRGRRLLGTGTYQIASLRSQLTLYSMPASNLQFGLRIIHHNLSIMMSTPSTIEFDAIY